MEEPGVLQPAAQTLRYGFLVGVVRHNLASIAGGNDSRDDRGQPCWMTEPRQKEKRRRTRNWSNLEWYFKGITTGK